MAKKIKTEEQSAAAKYFAMSNCAVLHLCEGIKNIDHAYSQADGIVMMETGVSLDDERRSWLKEIQKGKGSYVAEEWDRVKSQWGY